MPSFAKLLLIAESAAFRRVLAGVLTSYADQVLTAASARAGRQKIAEHADISLVLSESATSDGSGFQLLDYVAALGDPKPRVILLGEQRGQEEVERALNMGAIGYLGKPVSLQEIHRLWKESGGPTRETASRVRSLGQALLIDPSEVGRSGRGISHLTWGIRNLSITGAFLETKAPLPISTELHLALALGSARGDVKAEVVRVQEPSWRCVGGVGVAFREFGDGTRELISGYVARAMKTPEEHAAPLLARSGGASS